MAIGKFVMKQISANGNVFNELLGYGEDSVISNTTARNAIITFAKQISNITTNSYESTTATFEYELDSMNTE